MARGSVRAPEPAAVNVALLTPVYWPEVRRGTERFTHELAGGLLRARAPPAAHHVAPRPAAARAVEDGRGGRARAAPPGRPPAAPHVRGAPHARAVRLRRAAPRPRRRRVRRVPDRRARRAALARARPAGPSSWRTWGSRTASRSPTAAGARRSCARAARDADAVTVPRARGARASGAGWGSTRASSRPGSTSTRSRPGRARARSRRSSARPTATQPRKRVGLLAEAFARVRRERPGARLVVSRVRDAGPLALDGAERARPRRPRRARRRLPRGVGVGAAVVGRGVRPGPRRGAGLRHAGRRARRARSSTARRSGASSTAPTTTRRASPPRCWSRSSWRAHPRPPSPAAPAPRTSRPTAPPTPTSRSSRSCSPVLAEAIARDRARAARTTRSCSTSAAGRRRSRAPTG